MSQSTPTPTDPREDIYNTYASMFGGMDLVVPLDVARNIIDGLTSELATAREERDSAVAKASNLFDGSVVLGADNETLQAELEAARKERDEVRESHRREIGRLIEQRDGYMDVARRESLAAVDALAAKDAAERLINALESIPKTHAIGLAPSGTWQYFGENGNAAKPTKTARELLEVIAALTPAPTQEPPAGGVTISNDSSIAEGREGTIGTPVATGKPLSEVCTDVTISETPESSTGSENQASPAVTISEGGDVLCAQDRVTTNQSGASNSPADVPSEGRGELLPFDLTKAMSSGVKIVTRDGRVVDCLGRYQLLSGFIEGWVYGKAPRFWCAWTETGRANWNEESPLDLFMLPTEGSGA